MGGRSSKAPAETAKAPTRSPGESRQGGAAQTSHHEETRHEYTYLSMVPDVEAEGFSAEMISLH